MKKTILAFFTTLALPVVALAQRPGTSQIDTTYIDDIIAAFQGWLGTAVTVIMVLMTLWFLWTVFKFIGAKEPADIQTRKKQMINGLIGLAVAVSVWGIIKIAQNVFGIDGRVDYGVTCPPGYRNAPGTGRCIPR